MTSVLLSLLSYLRQISALLLLALAIASCIAVSQAYGFDSDGFEYDFDRFDGYDSDNFYRPGGYGGFGRPRGFHRLGGFGRLPYYR